MDNYGAVKAVATKILGDIPFGSNPKDGVSDDKSLNQNIQMQEKEGVDPHLGLIFCSLLLARCHHLGEATCHILTSC